MPIVDPNAKPAPPTAFFHRHRKCFFMTLLVTLALLLAWWYWRTLSSAQQQRGIPLLPQAVTVVAASRGDMEVTLLALGSVTPNRTVVVTSRVDGQLNRVLFQEGQWVKAGQLLAQLDPRPFQIQLTRAKGQLMRDTALLDNANKDLARYQMLQLQNSVAQQQVDTQQALVRQYQAVVEIDQGLVADAQLQLTYSRITAPMSGQLGIRLVDEGNIIHANDAAGLVVITQMQPSFVLFSIPENELDKVVAPFSSGIPLKVEAWSADNCTQIATGVLTAIDNRVDSATGTVKLKARFDNQYNTLFPNRFVNVKLTLSTRYSATLLPLAAVQRGKPGTYVFVVKPDQTVTLRPVMVGAADRTRVVITQGVAVGEQVVLDSTDRLREGSPVRGVKPVRDPGLDSDTAAGKEHCYQYEANSQAHKEG